MKNPARSISLPTIATRISASTRSAAAPSTLSSSRRPSVIRMCEVKFNHRCTDVDLDAPSAQLLNLSTSQPLKASADAIIGVDGAFSSVRRSMQRLDRFEYSQSYLAHGYKELTIPPATNGAWQMEKNALHIWPRKSFMMIALPNPDGSFTCTLFWEFDGPRSFATTVDDDDVRRFFDDEFPDAVPLMPALLDDFRENPTGSLVTIRCAGMSGTASGKFIVEKAPHLVIVNGGRRSSAGRQIPRKGCR